METISPLAFLVGRLLFGGLLAFAGLSNFMNASEMVSMAQSKGVPAAGVGVIASSVLLVLGGGGIVFGVYPIIAAGMLALFFLVVTPTMHDFWAVPEEEQQNQMIHFMKNTFLFGASLVILTLGGEPWPYALNIGL